MEEKTAPSHIQSFQLVPPLQAETWHWEVEQWEQLRGEEPVMWEVEKKGWAGLPWTNPVIAHEVLS